mgnify:CR=1 FL=1
MERPERGADCIAAMSAAVDVPVTVKCRIGVDDQEPREVLPDFIGSVAEAGASQVTVHARKAWLQGLSPKETRDIPPLDYELVYQMKRDFPDLMMSINGGITTLQEAQKHLEAGMDGVMIGRAAYHSPAEILLPADGIIFRDPGDQTAESAVLQMLPYIEAELLKGAKLGQMTRHMLGLFSGQPGARGWRQVLSSKCHQPGAGPEVVLEALARVRPEAA